MKYVAILDSDDRLSEEAIKYLTENTLFIGDETTPYCFTITSIKKAPVSSRCNQGMIEDDFWERMGYDRALRECGVLEE